MFRLKGEQITRLNYCPYLLSSQTNYTITNYAEHVEHLSHDMVNRYLRDEKLTPRLVWEHTEPQIIRDESGYIVFDARIIDKTHSREIEGLRWQYSGNAHGIIRGIGMVNCIYINPNTEQFWVIDFRIFDPERDGKTKMDHVRDMLNNVHYNKHLSYRTVLMDSWYASAALILFISDRASSFTVQLKAIEWQGSPRAKSITRK
jgi:hypothetical protein